MSGKNKAVTQGDKDELINSIMSVQRLYMNTSTDSKKPHVIDKLSEYIKGVGINQQIQNNRSQLDSLLRVDGPCLLFFNHTVDDIFALTLIMRFLSHSGKKLCVLQKETAYNEQSSLIGNNVMYCNVASRDCLDKLTQAVNEQCLVIIFPDAVTATYNASYNTINVSNMFGGERVQHHNPLVSNLLQRDISIYKNQLCDMSKVLSIDVIPILGLLKSTFSELKVHPRVKPFEGQGEAAKDNFMRLIYDEKVDYLVKSFERYTLLEGHLHTHAWSNSGVLDRV